MSADRDPRARERRSDQDLLARVRIHARENWYRDVWLLLITIIVALSAWEGKLLSDKANATAQRAAILAKQNEALSQRVQSQRRQNVRAQCEEQNRRHDQTIARLKQAQATQAREGPGQLAVLFAAVGIHVDAAGRVRLTRFQTLENRASFATTEFLINALQPHQNCDVLVNVALGVKLRKPAKRVPPIKPSKLAIPPILPNPDQQSR